MKYKNPENDEELKEQAQFFLDSINQYAQKKELQIQPFQWE